MAESDSSHALPGMEADETLTVDEDLVDEFRERAVDATGTHVRGRVVGIQQEYVGVDARDTWGSNIDEGVVVHLDVSVRGEDETVRFTYAKPKVPATTAPLSRVFDTYDVPWDDVGSIVGSMVWLRPVSGDPGWKLATSGLPEPDAIADEEWPRPNPNHPAWEAHDLQMDLARLVSHSITHFWATTASHVGPGEPSEYAQERREENREAIVGFAVLVVLVVGLFVWIF